MRHSFAHSLSINGTPFSSRSRASERRARSSQAPLIKRIRPATGAMGCDSEVPMLHFEVCSYAAIEDCIA